MAVKKEKKIKPRNAGTMTEAAFWNWIRSWLRNKSRHWRPISEAKMLVRRKNESIDKKNRHKFEYQCKSCQDWFPDKEIDVDHVVPAGQLKSIEDLPIFFSKLFCEVEELQVLCKECHYEKTMSEKVNNKKRKV